MSALVQRSGMRYFLRHAGILGAYFSHYTRHYDNQLAARWFFGQDRAWRTNVLEHAYTLQGQLFVLLGHEFVVVEQSINLLGSRRMDALPQIPPPGSN